VFALAKEVVHAACGWFVGDNGSVGILSTCAVLQSTVAPCMNATLPVGKGAVVCPAGAGTVAVNVTEWLTVVVVDEDVRVTAGDDLPTVSVNVAGLLTVKFVSPE
jgi:hypothetical protein